MIDGFEKQIYIGIVFDIHDFTYNKDSGLKFIKKTFMDFFSNIGSSSKLYVSGNSKLPTTHGESVAQLNSYQIKDNDLFEKSFRDTLFGVGSQEGCKKIIFVCTNKFKPNNTYAYKNILRMNEDKNFNCSVHVLEFSKNSKELQEAVEDKKSNYYCILEMNYFNSILKDITKEIKNG
jgi:hypothetical protein